MKPDETAIATKADLNDFKTDLNDFGDCFEARLAQMKSRVIRWTVVTAVACSLAFGGFVAWMTAIVRP